MTCSHRSEQDLVKSNPFVLTLFRYGLRTAGPSLRLCATARIEHRLPKPHLAQCIDLAVILSSSVSACRSARTSAGFIPMRQLLSLLSCRDAYQI